MENNPQYPILRVAYTDSALVTMASAVVTNFQSAGVVTEGPVLEAPSRGVLGAPEILITIIATAAARAATKIAIRALRQYLESRVSANDHSRLQVVLDSPGHIKRRFPINIRSLTGEAIEEFLTEVVDAVEAL